MFFGGVVGILVFLLWVYCILDVISTDEYLVRNMPKLVWLLVVIVVPTVGSIAWLAVGRPERAGLRPGDTSVRPAPRPSLRPLGPDDSPEYLARIDDKARRLQQWEDDLRRREADLKRDQDDAP